jgi:hypothetical protein
MTVGPLRPPTGRRGRITRNPTPVSHIVDVKPAASGRKAETIMEKIVSTDKARQARWGRPVLIVLIVGLLLAMGVWVGVETWGEHIDAPAADDAGGSNTDSD